MQRDQKLKAEEFYLPFIIGHHETTERTQSVLDKDVTGERNVDE